jgi:hypothetical protein
MLIIMLNLIKYLLVSNTSANRILTFLSSVFFQQAYLKITNSFEYKDTYRAYENVI